MTKIVQIEGTSEDRNEDFLSKVREVNAKSIGRIAAKVNLDSLVGTASLVSIQVKIEAPKSGRTVIG